MQRLSLNCRLRTSMSLTGQSTAHTPSQYTDGETEPEIQISQDGQEAIHKIRKKFFLFLFSFLILAVAAGIFTIISLLAGAHFVWWTLYGELPPTHGASCFMEETCSSQPCYGEWRSHLNRLIGSDPLLFCRLKISRQVVKWQRQTWSGSSWPLSYQLFHCRSWKNFPQEAICLGLEL